MQCVKWRSDRNIYGGVTVKFRVFMYGLVCSALLFVAACAKSGNEPEATPTPTPATSAAPSASEAPATEEPIHIVWLSEDPPNEDNNEIQKFLEQKFNVTIENVKFDNSSYKEKLNIRIANKEIPDMMFGRFDYEALARQGVLAELPVEEIKAKMPKYAASVDAMDPAVWTGLLVDGKNYMIPRYNFDGGIPLLPQYRYDWMKKVGIEKTPETLAEFEALCDKFTNGDPDGNGKKDTYCISASPSYTIPFQLVYGAFDNQIGHYSKDANGKIIYNVIRDETKEALKVLRDWVKKGYIDPEYITNTGQMTNSKWDNGVYGVTHGSYWYASSPDMIGTNTLFTVNPNAELIAGKPIYAPGHVGTGYAFNILQKGMSMGVHVQNDEAKKNKIYEILEALATDPETYLTTFYGMEGVHYDLVDGIVVSRPGFEELGKRGFDIGAGEYYNPFGRTSKPMSVYTRSKAQLEFYDTFVKDLKGSVSLVNFTIPERANYPDLPKIEDQYFVKFLSGELDVEAGWNEFVQTWLKSGGQAVLDSADKEYKARNP